MIVSSGGFVLLAQAGATVSGSTILVIIAICLVAGWVLSLRLHPYTACSACKGSPRLFGLVARRSFRICSTCGGNGRRKRFMADIWSHNRTL